jgi:hypothetical protein
MTLRPALQSQERAAARFKSAATSAYHSSDSGGFSSSQTFFGIAFFTGFLCADLEPARTYHAPSSCPGWPSLAFSVEPSESEALVA